MKKCSDCNVEMIDNAKIFDDSSNIFISFLNGKREVKNFFGNIKVKKIQCNKELKARICPTCGKVELYIDPDDLNIK